MDLGGCGDPWQAMTGTIRKDLDGKVCTLTIENEGKRNAIDFDMCEELTAALEALEERDERTIVVLRGAGEKAFSAGFDLSVDRSDRTEREKGLWREMTDALEAYTFPTIAMVNGVTYGGAMEVIAACDIRIGVDDAEFGITPAKIGLVYGGRAINRIMRLVGPAKTREMLYTAEAIDAEHAEDIGLLNYAVAREDLEDRTYDMAETIAGRAPFSLRSMKEIIDAILEKGRLSEAETKWVQRLRDQAFASDDHAEGKAAFNEGRDPEFEGV